VAARFGGAPAMRNPAMVKTMSIHNGPVSQVAFSPDEAHATASRPDIRRPAQCSDDIYRLPRVCGSARQSVVATERAAGAGNPDWR
jgi:hypothetical protein